VPEIDSPIRILFATSEAAPIARVGGLAEASAGLVRSLRRTNSVELTLVIPDYGDVVLTEETIRDLDVPRWVGGATVRSGIAPELGRVELVSTSGMARPHPYVDTDGQGWEDNDTRFFGFSAAVAAMANEGNTDLLHVNDWHTALALAMTEIASVFTIHTLGYQGRSDVGWVDVVGGPRISSFDRVDHLNPVAGAIALADAVVAVSPSYAQEILDPHRGEGLHLDLQERGTDLVGICNGIDTDLWDPMTDPHLVANYGRTTLDAKQKCRAHLASMASWPDDQDLILGMVTRMVDQKGIDLILGLLPYLSGVGVRVFVLGSGDEHLSRWAREVAEANPDRVHFVDGYDLALAHQIFAGADLLAMSSRFEPCGLAQMQAMRYGTVPVVTPVGGLRDTVIDAVDYPDAGTGFVARTIDSAGMLDALHRAVAVLGDADRRNAIVQRGMSTDWSWERPAERFVDLYRKVLAERACEGEAI